MIIEDLTQDDIQYVIEHINSVCACRDACKGCHYAKKEIIADITRYACALNGIPAEWYVEKIGKEGDADDQSE